MLVKDHLNVGKGSFECWYRISIPLVKDRVFNFFFFNGPGANLFMVLCYFFITSSRCHYKDIIALLTCSIVTLPLVCTYYRARARSSEL